MAHSRDGFFRSPPFNLPNPFDPLPPRSNELMFIDEIFRSWKMRTDVEIMLLECFNKSINPYTTCLSLLHNLYKKPVNFSNGSLAEKVLDTFKTWHNKIGQPSKHLLNDATKMDAFYLGAKSSRPAFLFKFVEIFDLAQNKDLFIQPINDLLNKHSYREVSVWVTVLKLNGYGLPNLLIPCFLQNKIFIIDEFLSTNPEHQEEFLTFLDKLLGIKCLKNHLDTLVDEMDIPNPATHVWTIRSIKKLLKRLCAKFDIPEENFPTFLKKRELSSVYHLIYERFIHNRISLESFRELAKDPIDSNQYILQDFISKLTQVGQFKEALHWSKLYNIPESDLPFRVTENNPSSGVAETQTESDWEVDCSVQEDFYKLSLPLERVLLIQSEIDFCLMVTDLENASLAGIDSEWKPSINGQTQVPSLLQIALSDRVYLVDLIAVKNFPYLWKELMSKFFMSHHITKLGFSLDDDYRALSRYLPDEKMPFKAHKSLDLNRLWHHLTNKCNLSLPYSESSEAGYSLSHLVYLCLGRKLDKREQFSNWTVRPLRETQKYYAALDAFCLLEVYNVMATVCARNDVLLEEVIREVMEPSAKRTSKQKYTNWRDDSEGPIYSTPVDVNSVKIVCDTSLMALGRCLRYCGIDTALVRFADDLTEYMHREKRFLLTAGRTAIKKFNSDVPKDRKMIVKSSKPYDQINEVLSYINIKIMYSNLLTRCPECNSDLIVKIHCEKMKSILNVNPRNGGASGGSNRSGPGMPAGMEDELEYDYDCFDDGFDDSYVEESYNFSDDGKAVQILTESGVPMKNVEKIQAYKLWETGIEFQCCQSCGFTFWKDNEISQMFKFIRISLNEVDSSKSHCSHQSV